MNRERVQRAFTAHIRDPKGQPAPDGVEDRRMKIYRDLFFNNMQSLLAGNFPVLRKIYGKTRWRQLIREFYSEHLNRTPLFPEIAREFLRYLQDERDGREDDPPFLLELAHYEWVEMALELDERDLDDESVDCEGNLLQGVPVLSPLVHLLGYRFPVHRIGPDFQPALPPDRATHLLVYRNASDDIGFIQLNDVSRHLLERIGQEPGASGRELLEEVARTLQHPDPQRVVTAGTDLLEDFRHKDILLGTRRTR